MKEIPLSQGKVALVDDADFDRLSQHKWCAAKDRYTYYAVRSVTFGPNQERRIWMHREMIATISQNGANRRIGSNNTSGVKGVTFHKQVGKWQASICVHGILIHLGKYRELRAAECIYKLAAFKYFGDFAGEPS